MDNLQSTNHCSPSLARLSELERARFDELYSRPAVFTPLPEHIVPREEYALWDKYVGPIAGKRVLECGSGDGAKAVWLANRGADVQAVELSPVGTARTLERARHYGVPDRVQAYAGDCCALERYIEPNSIDLALGFSVLHHLPSQAFGRSLRAVLKSGAHAVFFENSNANPIYRFLRRIRNDESACGSPLTFEEVQELIAQVGDGACVFPRFGLFALSRKYVFKQNRVFAALVETIDRVIDMVPGTRPWSAHMWVVLRKPHVTVRSSRAAT
jgi:SAM-dependent methyltransferase